MFSNILPTRLFLWEGKLVRSRAISSKDETLFSRTLKLLLIKDIFRCIRTGADLGGGAPDAPPPTPIVIRCHVTF